MTGSDNDIGDGIYLVETIRFTLIQLIPTDMAGLHFNSLNQSTKIVWKWAIFWIKGWRRDDETANIVMK